MKKYLRYVTLQIYRFYIEGILVNTLSMHLVPLGEKPTTYLSSKLRMHEVTEVLFGCVRGIETNAIITLYNNIFNSIFQFA